MKTLKKRTQSPTPHQQFKSRVKKEEVRLKNNAVIYFQIGLILSLLAAYALFEMEFYTKTAQVPDYPHLVDSPVEWTPEPVVPEEKKPIEKEVRPKKKTQNPNFKPTDDQDPVKEENPFKDPAPEPQPDLNPDDMDPLPDKPEDDYTPWNKLEQVPIYPGCEKQKNNQDRLKCMSKKLSKLVQRRFDQNAGERAGLKQDHKIFLYFKIDKAGAVQPVMVRTPYPELEEAGLKFIEKIPDMQAAKQGHKPVNVMYSLPIVVSVRY